MPTGIRWCPHCHEPHKLSDRFCRQTGLELERGVQNAEPAHLARRPMIGIVIDGKYKVMERIGAGGMGEIYEAMNLGLQRRVVLKIVSRVTGSARKRLQQEGRVIASLQHPNICDLYDVGELADGSPYLVLERLNGQTLAALHRRTPRLPIIDAIDIFIQMLSALRSAHEAGIIHRDLKPANVFLVSRLGCPPHVKLLDFGLAKRHIEVESMGLTRPGKAVGTLSYMAPEQMRGAKVDARSDLFSIGLMLFETLAGQHPFTAGSSTQIATKILGTPAPHLVTLCDVPMELDQLIDRTLRKNPDERPQSAAELQVSLSRLVRIEQASEMELFDPSSSHSDEGTMPHLVNTETTSGGPASR